VKSNTGQIFPVVQLLCEKEVSNGGADVVRTEVASSVIGEDSSQEVHHGDPGGIRRICNLQAVGHQEEVGEAELVEVQGWTSVRAVTVRKTSSSSKVSGGGGGIQRRKPGSRSLWNRSRLGIRKTRCSCLIGLQRLDEVGAIMIDHSGRNVLKNESGE
jgi:hypothetical protein